MCCLYLRNVKGFVWNHKRVYRVDTLLKLNVQRKAKRPFPDPNPLPIKVPDQANICWSMVFMSDTLAQGHQHRTFNVLNDIKSGIQAKRGYLFPRYKRERHLW